jgi:hypothetical protein
MNLVEPRISLTELPAGTAVCLVVSAVSQIPFPFLSFDFGVPRGWRIGRALCDLCGRQKSCANRTPRLLYRDLLGAVESHVRLAAIEPDRAGDADASVEVILLRVAEFTAVEAPDDCREHLVGIGPAEIDERRLAAGFECEMHARHLAAHFRGFPRVVFGLFRSDGLRLGGPRGKRCARHENKQNAT